METTKLERVLAAWIPCVRDQLRDPPFDTIATGRLSRDRYAGLLREIYFQVREHPAALARLTANLRGERRRMTRTLLKHALAETGHDELALADLAALGHDPAAVAIAQPLPGTTTLLGYMERLLDTGSPVAFLGYLFHLEFLPTHAGGLLVEGLRSSGIPPEAMSFLADHVKLDEAHNKLMERYLDELVTSDDELDEVIEAARTTAFLYARMLQDASNVPEPKPHPDGNELQTNIPSNLRY